MMNCSKLSSLAVCSVLAFLTQAANYNADWSKGDPITIGGVTYHDLLTPAVWGGTDPTTLASGDNLIMNHSSADISLSANATLNPYVVSGTANSRYAINLNGKTLTATQNGLRNMTKGARFTVSNGSLKLGNLLWPDRSASDDVKSNNVFTVTGSGTFVDIACLYFGHNMGSKPGAGAGNKVVVTGGAFMAANVGLARYCNAPGQPNGLYVTGSGTVFSNKSADATLIVQNNLGNTTTGSAASFSNEFVVADGAVVKNIDRFLIGTNIRDRFPHGKGHLLAFRGAGTSHRFSSGDKSMLGFSHRLEVDGAAVTNVAGINNYGAVTVKNGGALVGPFSQWGRLVVSGQGSRFESPALDLGLEDLPAVLTCVTDGAELTCGNSLLLGGNGCTNGCIYVRDGGKVTCAGGIYLGYANEDPKYDIAPYGCVLEVDGDGSVVTNGGMTVGTCRLANQNATGCCTNGHDNVIRISNGGKIFSNPNSSVSIGFVCASNALEVLDGGLLECGTLYIGRAGSGWVGAVKADKVAFDNRCVVAGGEIQSTGLVSIRGNNSLCYVTNGVIHTTCTNILETTSNTGYLQIAGTNSLLKGDVEFRASAVGAKIDFVLPSEGYVRAPIQSDNLVKFVDSVDIGFIPPAPGEKVARVYTLAQVPASGTLTVPNALLTSLRTKLAALAAQDARFEEHAVVVKVENGFRRLQLATPSGTLIMFK